ncbi:uncharacterized protein [Drosophila kikkawai]|uniref:Uncharacterized protein n=1 Tax=Drosophila kikkawai TaxID=30033 RepID=A0A6P4J378_DROKI|nr:uncharacterized protein LOC108079231 [Drosophila kikkawai]
MEKFVKASCLGKLLFKKSSPQLDKDKAIEVDKDEGGTVKLNASAPEFVPRNYKKGEKKDAMTQVKAGSGEDLGALEEDEIVKLYWRQFPNLSMKAGQVVLLNDREYTIMPCLKAGKKIREYCHGNPIDYGKEMVTSTSPYEERLLILENKRQAVQEHLRFQERQVALEALMLEEQRRCRRPFFPNNMSGASLESPMSVIHLSHSPVRYTAQERMRVDNLRYAKKERIERMLREMGGEKNQQQQQQQQEKDSSSKRYIPTAKEWDEQLQAKLRGNRQAKPKAERKEVELPVAVHHPDARNRYRLPGERRNHNHGTNTRSLPDWPLQMPQNSDNDRFVLRYAIEDLRQLQPQPEDL